MSIPLRVLVVDDDEDDVLILEYMLLDALASRPALTWCKTVAEGLERIEAEPFDVCFVDYRIGAETGLDFLSRRADRARTVPVVVLSGQIELAEGALAAGATRSVEKSAVNATVIRELLEEIVTEFEG